MCSGHDPIQGIEPLAVKAVVARPNRLLRVIGLALGLACLLAIVLPVIFPNASPERLGELVGTGVVLASVGIYFLRYRPWLLIVGCMFGCLVFVVLAVVAYLGATAKATANFRTAAAMPFVQEAADGMSVFTHRALGISVEALGTKYTQLPMKTKRDATAWSFADKSAGRFLSVIAAHENANTPAKLQDCLKRFLQDFNKRAGAKTRLKPTGQETVVWEFDRRFAQVEGTIQNNKFCLYMCPVGGGRAGNYAVFAVLAIAPDSTIACDTARSLCVTNSAFAGDRVNDPKKAALVKR